jgi:hypothetical protein
MSYNFGVITTRLHRPHELAGLTTLTWIPRGLYGRHAVGVYIFATVTLTHHVYLQKSKREVPKKLRGCSNSCCANVPCRGKRPQHFLHPSWVYVLQSPSTASPSGYNVQTSTGRAVLRHRDYVGREVTYDPSKAGQLAKATTDRYLHHDDGRLRTLIVACSDDIWDAAVAHRTGATWRRTYARSQAPLKVRIVAWVIDYSPKRSCEWYLVELLKLPVAMAGLMFVVRTLTSYSRLPLPCPVPFVFLSVVVLD